MNIYIYIMNECNICFENFKFDNKIFICKKCGKYYHKDCYKQWNKIKKDDRCIFCMTKNSIINKKSKLNININKRDYCIYYCNIL